MFQMRLIIIKEYSTLLYIKLHVYVEEARDNDGERKKYIDYLEFKLSDKEVGSSFGAESSNTQIWAVGDGEWLTVINCFYDASESNKIRGIQFKVIYHLRS